VHDKTFGEGRTLGESTSAHYRARTRSRLTGE
jgi:hypothetical protein